MCMERSKAPTYLIWGLGRVLLDTGFIASVDSKAQDVAGVLEGAATQQHLIHGHWHSLAQRLGCSACHEAEQQAGRQAQGYIKPSTHACIFSMAAGLEHAACMLGAFAWNHCAQAYKLDNGMQY